MLDQFLTTNTPTPHQTDRQSNSHISHRERDDAYLGTIVQFCQRWRLVHCKDQMQWIIQKKESSRRGDWRGLKYLTCKESVLKASGSLGLLSDPNTEAVLTTLPERARDYRKK
jgi:hypothetical protein